MSRESADEFRAGRLWHVDVKLHFDLRKDEFVDEDAAIDYVTSELGSAVSVADGVDIDVSEQENASALDRAIAYLGAVQVADPDPAHTSPLYAYRDPAGSGRYAVMSADYLLLAHDTDDPLVLMPHWWTPERRYAVRSGSLPDIVHVTMAAKGDARMPAPAYIVTADLETGEEIPA